MREKRNNERKRTVKSRKHQNAWREGKLEVLMNIGSVLHQTNRENIRKEYLKRIRKLLEPSSLIEISSINGWTVPHIRYSGLFLK